MIRLYTYLAAFAAGVAMLVSVFFAGRRAADADTKVDALQDYIDTNERVRDVEINDTRSGALERLRENSQLRD
jgi:hypothetical protein